MIYACVNFLVLSVVCCLQFPKLIVWWSDNARSFLCMICKSISKKLYSWSKTLQWYLERMQWSEGVGWVNSDWAVFSDLMLWMIIFFSHACLSKGIVDICKYYLVFYEGKWPFPQICWDIYQIKKKKKLWTYLSRKLIEEKKLTNKEDILRKNPSYRKWEA